MPRNELRDNLTRIAIDIANYVADQDAAYGSSWKRRGGTGAFMVKARKFDRIENQIKDKAYDIFSKKKDEGFLDDVNDLIGYLLLISNELE